MKLTAEREDFLAPLQSVIGVVERRQTMPVLANVLLGVRRRATERSRPRIWRSSWSPRREVTVQQAGDITVPGRKLLDIFRALPEKANVTLTAEGEKVVIMRAGRSRFTLSTLPAAEFPVIDDINAQQTLQIPRKRVAPADRQDALLDGAAGRALLLERHAARDRRARLRAVATDGHRLALCESTLPAGPGPPSKSSCRARACSSCSASGGGGQR